MLQLKRAKPIVSGKYLIPIRKAGKVKTISKPKVIIGAKRFHGFTFLVNKAVAVKRIGQTKSSI